ncbi:hypothetical protein [Hydrogenophaga sp. 2FB]|uniref:hypothetical protein n=1 Tax=Hydrogenophaga sp. 2FB TaxID=2502187 RepID=UPI0010F68B29|nr:hypothetical protein [Hydrogenophaga sp. 2FB]
MSNVIGQRVKAACIGVFVVLAFSAHGAWNVMQEKVRAQNNVTESVDRWTVSFAALNSSIEQWNKTFTKETSLQDLRGLLELANLEKSGLSIQADDIGVSAVEPVRHNNLNIGLTRMCLSSQGVADGKSLEVSAADYRTLFAGVKHLTDRADISIKNIVIRGDKKLPTATLGDFCVLLSRS